MLAYIRTSLLLVILFPAHIYAAISGIYDPRSLGMGGTTTASANLENAPFYNPALLSFHDEYEEDSLSGRVFLPSFIVVGTKSLRETYDVYDSDIYGRFSSALDTYNETGGTETAQSALDIVREAKAEIDKSNNEQYGGEASIGFTIVEPSKREGGAFYFNRRIIGAGNATVAEDDSQLLDTYIEEFDFIINSGGGVFQNLELYREGNPLNGLVDPRDSLASQAEIGGLIISEWGVAAAMEFDLYNYPVSFGVTPKITRVTAYKDSWNFSSSDFDIQTSKRVHIALNMDFGVASQITNKFRVGFAIKDLLPKSFNSNNGNNGNSIKLRPHAKAGVAYIHKRFLLGVDIDLNKRNAFANETAPQYISIGSDIRLTDHVQLRLGLNTDINSDIGETFSAGVAYTIYRFIFEGSVSSGTNTEGLGLQAGWAF